MHPPFEFGRAWAVVERPAPAGLLPQITACLADAERVMRAAVREAGADA